MSYLRDRLIGEHVQTNYPNARIVNFDDKDSGLLFYTADELKEVDADWFPLCCYKDPQTEKAVYGGRDKVFHTYTEGETGSGKTTRFVMQSIRALSSLKDKPSFVIVDIHGEIIENLYNHLKKNGYEIKVLNCDDPQRSDTYNPFTELVKDCLENREIGNEAINRIRKISEIMQPIESDRDPIWDRGARSYTNGCILDKFEDLIAGDIPIECMTIYNVIQNHYWIRDKVGSNFTTNLFSIPHYRKKGSDALSTQKMIAVTNNAEKTRASYYGVVENHYDNFGQPSLYALSSSNTIDITRFIEKPTVIVIQSGNTTTGDDLISLLMNDIYTCVVKMGKKSATKMLPRRIHCFLDEFANCNIADGPEYIKMLTTSRKFGMYWHMFLQCDAQLDRKFDADIGKIIRANCTEIFLGSNDHETSVRFARSCGQKTIESLGSSVSKQAPSLEIVDLMTTDRLNLTEEGYMYIKCNRHPLMRSYFEAFYKCPEFERLDDIEDAYPTNDLDYKKTAFYPSDIPMKLSREEYEVFEYICREKPSAEQIVSEFPQYDVRKIMRFLMRRYFVINNGDDGYEPGVFGATATLFKYRYYNGIFRTPEEDAQMMAQKKKNPFDFDNDDDEDEDDYSPDDSNFEGDPFFSDDKKIEVDNSLLSDLRDHLNEKEYVYVEDYEKLTSVPKFLMDAVRYYGGEREDASELNIRCAFEFNVNRFKFEVIETYIRENDYVTKALWEKGIQEELETIKEDELFTPAITEIFKNAVYEITEELTLGNIFEIKKIINGD